MSFFTILLTGVGLSMDAVAVSVSSGMAPMRRDIASAKLDALSKGAALARMPGVEFTVDERVLENGIAFLKETASEGAAANKTAAGCISAATPAKVTNRILARRKFARILLLDDRMFAPSRASMFGN